MKNMVKNKKILIGGISAIAVVILGIAIVLLIKNTIKKDKLKEIQDSIENVFFYLPEEKYDNLNDIPDYCKVSLVYGTDYIKSDALLSTDDYDTVLDKKGDNTTEAYNIETILNAVKKVLGDDSTINFDANEDGDYEFIEENGCGYNNKSIGKLSYNVQNEYIYTKEQKEIQKVYVKWEEPQIDGDNITLTAYALLPLSNDDGSYTVYANGSLNLVAGTIEAGKNLDEEISNMYNDSLKYVIKLKKNNDDYTWVSYEVIDEVYTKSADDRVTTKQELEEN